MHSGTTASILAFVMALLLTEAASAAGFVTAKGSELFLDGKPYRAIGVNIPHLSQAYNGTWHHWRGIYGSREKMWQSIIEAVADAERHSVAFVRFFAGPGYPKGTAELYLKDKDEYWRQMDEVFELCRKRRLKLIPSLGILKWLSDCRELMTAVLDPKSKTYVATYG